MRLQIFLILIILNLTDSIKGYSQNLFDNLQLSVGYAILPQDRRLFEYPPRLGVIEMEDSKYDYQFDVSLYKNLYTKGNFFLDGGLGYSIYTSKFSRPFDHNYFTGGLTKELRHIAIYSIHSIKCGGSLKLHIIKASKNVFSLILPIGCYFAFNKSIDDSHGNWQKNKWNFEFSKLETYFGLEYTNNRLSVGISNRIFNLQEVDPVIFFSALFNTSYPAFLSKETENINLNKFMIHATYQL